MCRRALAAIVAAALLAAGVPVGAQVKLRFLPPVFQIQKQLPRQPRMNRQPQVPIQVIPPSQALSIASRMVPNAKPVGVKLLNNNNYVVTLRQNNVVTRVIVNAQTGAAN